jgi:hypothetical protein
MVLFDWVLEIRIFFAWFLEWNCMECLILLDFPVDSGV